MELVIPLVWGMHLVLPLLGILWLARRNERLAQERTIRIIRDRKYYNMGRRRR